MTRLFSIPPLIVSALATIVLVSATIAQSSPQYGISMYGKPALKADFAHLPHANPDAPQGGRIILGESGGFDSLNPYILKGRAPWGIGIHTVESLMGRSYDEAFGLYGLLAETIETDAARSYVAFTLREQARFSDGSPVTIEDVLWSFETLATKGHPRYVSAWAKVAKAEQTGPRSVKFTFNTSDRELPLILGLRPILQKSSWEGRVFQDSGLDRVIGSGPYMVDKFEVNRYISFKKNPDYWGRDIPFNKGRHNLDEIRYDFFKDADVVFQAFKAGEINIYRENNAGRWDTHYNFPSVIKGDVTKSVIPHQRPSGIRGIVMNTRKAQLADIRVRDALIHAFNFEFINQTINGVPQPRITSYYSNSILGMEAGAATGKVRDLLTPFAKTLPPEALTGYALPTADGSPRNRKNLRQAKALLAQAGWNIQDGVLKNAQGVPFTLNIMLRAGALNDEAIANIYTDALKRLGIRLTISMIDSAQYNERANSYDFDMTFYRRALSLSPGNEQRLYWGAQGVTQHGTRNYMGMDSPAAEAMIDAMLNATDQTDFVAAVKALDRVLTTGRYVIPLWHSLESRLAHDARLQFPKRLQLYGDWPGFVPDVWWWQE